MYNGQNIKNIIAQKILKQKDVYEAIGMKKATFNALLAENANPTAKNLEAIADYLKCSIDVFFDRDVKFQQNANINGNSNKIQNGNGNVMIENQAKEIKHLEELLKEKERTIQILLNQK